MGQLADALVLEPKAFLRGEISFALGVEAPACKIHFASSLEAGVSWLRAVHACDLILLGDGFGQDEIRRFVAKARRVATACNSIFIQFLKPGDSDNLNIALNLIAGIDGFICEPFCGDSLMDAIGVAQKLRAGGQEKRLEKAFAVVLHALRDEIDARSAGHSAHFSTAAREAARLIRQLRNDHAAAYDDAVVELFSRCPLPISSITKSKLEIESSGGQGARMRHLLEALRDPFSVNRARAIQEFGRFGPEAKECVPELIGCLNDPSILCRHRAARALADIGTREALAATRRYFNR